MPPVPAAGVPLRVAEPVPPVKVTPLGRLPDSVIVGVGLPMAVIVNEPLVPAVKVVLLALENTGALFTVNVKDCVALLPTPLPAVKEMLYVPFVPVAGVPLRVPVPFPLSANVTPFGSGPDSVKAGVGKPDAATWNVPAPPTEKVVLLALVIAGASSTVKVKLCVALLPIPLLAVIVMA